MRYLRIATVIGLFFVLVGCQVQNSKTKTANDTNIKTTNQYQQNFDTTSDSQAQKTLNTQSTNSKTMQETNTMNSDSENTTNEENVVYNQAIIKTNKGDITVQFYANLSPKTVANFTSLAEAGFYDGIKFHRVIKDFMIQAGDPLTKNDAMQARWGTGGPGYTFADEFNNKPLVRGSLAMANSGPDTNGSQFFIVTAESTPWLDGRHTNFGEVIDGLDVVMNISETATEGPDRPIDPVVIEGIILQ